MEDASFEDLLSKGNFCTVHQKNIHTLLIKICKSINNIRPAIMSDFSNLTLLSVEGGEGEGVVLPPVGFPCRVLQLRNGKSCFSNLSLDTFVPNLEFLLRPSLQM